MARPASFSLLAIGAKVSHAWLPLDCDHWTPRRLLPFRSLLRLACAAALLAVAAESRAGQPLPDSEAALLAMVVAADAKSGDVAPVEELKRDVAAKLGEIGTAASLAWLDAAAKQSPTVTVKELGCRAWFDRAVYPFDQEAAKAAWHIRQRAALDVYTARDDLGFLEEVAALDSSAPEVSAALAVIAKSGTGTAAKAAGDLAGGAPNSPHGNTRSLLLAEAWATAGIAPNAPELALLSDAGALYLLRLSEKFPAAERARLLAAARSHAGIASAAAFAEGRPGGLAVSEYLARDGATAAAVLASDGSPAMTAELAAALGDAATARHAALALMLQATAEARAALDEAASNVALDEALRIDIEGWLGR